MTRLLSPLLSRKMLTVSRAVPTVVLVAVDNEDERPHSIEVAERLRARGISSEVAPKADKFGKQIRFADRRGIPYVWFPGCGRGRRGQGHPDGRAASRRSGPLVSAAAGPQAGRLGGRLTGSPEDRSRSGGVLPTRSPPLSSEAVAAVGSPHREVVRVTTEAR